MAKKKKEAPYSFILFTDRTDIDDTARTAALAADPGAHDSFRSDGFGAGEGWERWVVALKNSQTGRWRIVKHERATGMDDDDSSVLHIQKTIREDLCFFDALDFCAQFEEKEDCAGAAIVTRAETDEIIPSYKTVAAACFVPLDINGLPHPAANGIIMTDGNFDKEAQDIAAQTGKLSATETALTIVPKTPLAPIEEGAEIADIKNKITALGNAADMIESAKSLRDIVKKAVEKDFRQIGKRDQILIKASNISGISYAGLAGATIFFPALSPLCFITFLVFQLTTAHRLVDQFEAKSKSTYRRHHDKLNGHKDLSLTDQRDYDLLVSFSRAAAGVYGLEYAGHLHRKGKKRKGRKVLDKTIKELCLPEKDAAVLRERFNGKSFVEKGGFLHLLDQAYEVMSAEINARIAAGMKNEFPGSPLRALPAPKPS